MGTIKAIWDHIQIKKDLIIHHDESPEDFMDRIKSHVMELHNLLLDSENKDCKLCLQKIEIECISWYMMGINEDLRQILEVYMFEVQDLPSPSIFEEVMKCSMKNWDLDDDKHKLKIEMADILSNKEDNPDANDELEDLLSVKSENVDDSEFDFNETPSDEEEFMEYEVDFTKLISNEDEELNKSHDNDTALFYTKNEHEFPLMNSQGLYQCYKCGDQFTSKYLLARHIKTHYCVDGKIQDFTKKDELDKMLELIKSLPKLKESARYKFKRTIKGKPRSKDKFCKFCDKNFGSDVDALKEHLETEHPGQTKFLCQHCPREFAQRKSYLYHLEMKHDIIVRNDNMKEVYSCTICGETLATKFEKYRHYKKFHRSDTNFYNKDKLMCSYCPKSFVYKKSLEAHEETHTGEYSFCCHLCGKGYSSRVPMEIHEKICGKIRSHKCSFCEHISKSLVEHHAHCKTHNQDEYEAKFQCKDCDEKFVTQNKLFVHRRKAHYKYKRIYGCKACPEKVYKKRFNSVQHIIANHSDFTPYQCRVCGMENKFDCGLRQHIKYNHKDATNEDKCVIYNKNPTLDGIIRDHMTIRKELIDKNK